ncbi:MAG: hypothetical protein GAK29_01692 [Acinetobacter bereziniae]|uniref:HipA-like kinase domain-containing protein n=1 Tax=Acinetobacter bereziniae TaxID=106648 RepID=A0A833PEX8_ACIBZ|nr:MAG: hypothetical protein GAK29_01692 [Acinetobacter bereziniae]
MFDYLYGVTFHNAVGNGKTKPCRISALDRDKKLHDIVIKLSAGCDRKEADLAIEAIGSFLACDLGIHTPQSFVVGIDPKFVNSISDNLFKKEKNLLSLSYPYAFGSSYLTGFNTITSPLPKLTELQLIQAAKIFAFDALIKNFDRKKSNPNCLTNGKDFAVIDHELAFYPKLFSMEPNIWDTGYMDTIPYKDHIFFDSLKNQNIDLSELKKSWLTLNNKRLEQYSLALPDDWRSSEIAAIAIKNALTHIKDIRDNIEPALHEIKRVLI